MFKIASVGGALTAALYTIFMVRKPTLVKVAQNTALEVAIFRYLTLVFFVPSRLKNIFEPRRHKEH